MEELLQLLKQADAARHRGASEDEISAVLNRVTGGQFGSRQDLLDHLRQQDLQQAVAPGKVAGTVEAFGRGASMGFSDELAGLLDAATSGPTENPLERYRAARDIARAQQDAFAAQHPALNATGQVLGGLSSGIASAGLLPAPASSVAGLTGQGALIGAGAGALSGAGENTDLSRLGSDVARSTAFGAGTGAILGAATKPVLGALGGVGRAVRALTTPTADANATATGILAQHLPRNAQDVLSGLEAARPGQPMLMDVSPELADVATSRNVPLRADVLDRLNVRNAGAGGRMADELLQAGQGPGATTLDAHTAQQYAQSQVRPTAEKLYRPLEEMYREIPDGPGYRALIRLSTQDPMVGKALGASMRDLGVRGRPGFTTMQTALQNLQDDASAAFQAGRGNEGVRLRESAKALSTAMEQAMPGFEAANRGYAPTKEVMRAFELADGALTRDPRVIRSELAGLKSEDARSAYRMVALDNAATKLRGLTPEADAFRASMVRGNQSVEPHLQALFDSPQDLNQFLQGADAEQMFRRTYNAFPGSKTFNRGQLSGEVFQAPGMGGRSGLLNRLTDLFQNSALAGRDARVSQALGERLTTTGPEASRVIDEAASRRALQELRDRLAGQTGNVLSATIGNKATGPARQVAGVGSVMLLQDLFRKLGIGTTPDMGN